MIFKISLNFKKNRWQNYFRMKREIKNRSDVFFLGNSFYIKVRTNSLLGPIFNDAIDDWQDHLERLTDFWETILFIKNNVEEIP